MATANDIQHGGDHYKGAEYQHWDFVCDIRLHYLLAQASRYIARWRRHEDGPLNLDKAEHYIAKAMERSDIQGSNVVMRHACFWRFAIANDVTMFEAAIIYYLMEGNLQAAKEGVTTLLSETPRDDRTAES